MVQYLKGLVTKDGRVRAARPLWGPHRRNTFPAKTLAAFACAVLVFAKRKYDDTTAMPKCKQFLNKIDIMPYGVLGTQLSLTGTLKSVGREPNSDTAIVDPAGLHHIHGSASNAGGASGAIYHYLGLTGAFPTDVRQFIHKATDAKLFKYPIPGAAPIPDTTPVKRPPGVPVDKTPSSNEATVVPEANLIQPTLPVIHVVGPDFRRGKWSEREASLELARAYRNVLHEFVVSDAKLLRLTPISGGIFSGDLSDQMPPITQEALSCGFDQLHQYDKEVILKPDRKIELCMFMEREWDPYCKAFDYISTPTQL